MATKTEVATTLENGVVGRLSRAELIQRRLQGASVTDIKLPSVSVPGSGGTTWELEDDEATKELVGVVIDDYSVDSFYASKFEGGNEPPDALWIGGEFQYANDAALAAGIVPGLLADNPLNVYNKEERRTPISNRWRIFLVRDGEFVPLRIEVPVMSKNTWYNFAFSKIEGRGYEPTDVRVKLTLEKAKSSSGIDYAKIVPKFEGPLDEPETAYEGSQREYYAQLAQSFRPLTRRSNTQPAAHVQQAIPDDQVVV